MRRILIATAIAGVAFMTPAVAHADNTNSAGVSISNSAGSSTSRSGLAGLGSLGDTIKQTISGLLVLGGNIK